MTRFLLPGLLSAFALLTSASSLQAQGFRQQINPNIRTPAFSPYLNLNRPGAQPFQNYYGLIRPENQFRNSFANVQGQINDNRQSISQFQNNPTIGDLATGHQVTFLNTGGYFLNNAGGGRGAGAGAAFGTAPTPATRPGAGAAPARQTPPSGNFITTPSDLPRGSRP